MIDKGEAEAYYSLIRADLYDDAGSVARAHMLQCIDTMKERDAEWWLHKLIHALRMASRYSNGHLVIS